MISDYQRFKACIIGFIKVCQFENRQFTRLVFASLHLSLSYTPTTHSWTHSWRPPHKFCPSCFKLSDHPDQFAYPVNNSTCLLICCSWITVLFYNSNVTDFKRLFITFSLTFFLLFIVCCIKKLWKGKNFVFI